MKILLVAVSALATTLLVACAAQRPAPPPPAVAAPTPRSEEEVSAELIAVLEAQQAAWNAGDIESFMQRGYLMSDAMTFLSGGTWTRGYEPVMARFKRVYTEERTEMGHLDFTDTETLVFSPDAGLVRGRWKLTYTDGSEPGGLFTVVLRRQADGTWRIVHDHTSSME